MKIVFESSEQVNRNERLDAIIQGARLEESDFYNFCKLVQENVNLLRFDNFMPNASKIYRESGEVRNDSDNNTDNIS